MCKAFLTLKAKRLWCLTDGLLLALKLLLLLYQLSKDNNMKSHQLLHTCSQSFFLSLFVQVSSFSVLQKSFQSHSDRARTLSCSHYARVHAPTDKRTDTNTHVPEPWADVPWHWYDLSRASLRYRLLYSHNWLRCYHARHGLAVGWHYRAKTRVLHLCLNLFALSFFLLRWRVSKTNN